MLTVILTIKGGIYAVQTCIMLITGKFICSVNSYCENNGEVNVQC